MLKILVPNRFSKNIKKKICLELGNVLGVKPGVLNDSELIGTMYLSLKSIIAWIIPTPLFYFNSKLDLCQCLYNSYIE